MLSILRLQGNANLNHNKMAEGHTQRRANPSHSEASPHAGQDSHCETSTTTGEGAEKETPGTAGGRELGPPVWRTVWRFLKKRKADHHMVQQSHSWASIPRKDRARHTTPTVHCSTVYSPQDMQATYVSIHR